MDNRIAVSVVVPIYGVEKFIERCAQSLFSQTLENMEFIFVDDCTKDNSINVLNNVIKEFPNRKSQISIIRHEVNKGLPQARKTGIQIAKGEYIAHCDSDDWVEVDMYQRLYNKAVSDNADIVICGYYKTDGVSYKEPVSIKPSSTLLLGPVWNKLTRRSLYTDYDIMYPVAGKAEDGALMVQLSYYSNSIVYIDDKLYNYFFNPESICRVMTEEAMLKRFEEEKQNVELRINFLKREKIFEKYKHDVIVWKWASRNILLPFYHNRKYRRLWRNTYPEINKQVFKDKDFRIALKMFFLAEYLGLYGLWNKIINVVLSK